ncbi:MAG: hypothetical protein ACOVSW_16100, partial [Candidatus Kapaibacteriota bacterium]
SLLFFSVFCFLYTACEDIGITPQETERDKYLLTLLEIRPESVKDSASCETIYALDGPDRYIYKRVRDDPPGTPRFEYDVPQTILDSMSTRGLLETGLGHPRNVELAPLAVCSSIWRCRESMFGFLMNVWTVFEKRPDALEECLKRYDRLNILCDPLLRSERVPFDINKSWVVLIQTSLIEAILTRPVFLNQLSTKVQRKLAAKILAKHKQKEMAYQSELGKTHGLWLLGALMLHAKDPSFTEATKSTIEVGSISQGLVLGHSLAAKSVIVAHAERFAAGK